MPKKRAGRAMWFKLTLHQKPLIDSVPDEVAGKALKAAMAYFQDRTQTELDPLTMAVFSVFKSSIDESLSGYAKAVEYGSRGGRPLEREGKGGLPTDTQGIPGVRDIDIRYTAKGQEALSPGICNHDTSWMTEVET